jgi:hypothetical protein
MEALRRWLAGASAVAAFLLAGYPVPAAAQSDAQGCRDGDLPRLAGFSINDCDPPASDHYVFAEGAPAQKDIRGSKSRVAYALQDGATVPAGADILSQYAALFRQGGWTVAASGDQRWIAAYRGGEWAQVEVNGGANYQIVYVTGSSAAAGVPARPYSLACDRLPIGDFSRADGLSETATSAEYRDGGDAVNRVRKNGGLGKTLPVTLAGGTLASAARAERHAQASTALGSPHECQVALHNEAGATIVLWQLHDARIATIASAPGSASVRLISEGITVGAGGQ